MPKSPTVALCMIVKDEAAIIERCLDSVRSLIDSWVIVDTGSSDGTPAVVRSALAGLPGQLHEREWRDFGSNRTELLELSRGAADYLLLLDADMTLRHEGSLPPLEADAYMIGHDGPVGYSVPRLVRGDFPWRYVGATHEYLTSDREFRLAELPAVSVTHHGDGASRQVKLTRDLELLSKQLSEDPDDPRTVFYLAQTYSDLGDVEQAKALYAARVALGGWEEEVFYAALRHATLVADSEWERGRELLVDVWQSRPQRVEPLYEIAVRARNVGDFPIAYWATRLGLGAPLPGDILFVHRWVYEWGMRFEHSIACAYMGRLGEAIELTDRLLADERVPDDVVAALVSNRAWLCSQPVAAERSVGRAGLRAGSKAGEIPTLAELCGADIWLLPSLPTECGWPQTNPSIADHEGRSFSIVRQVNWSLADDGGYVPIGGEDSFSTKNLFVELDRGLSVLRHVPLQERVAARRYATGVLGFEDCRLFAWRDRWWAVAASRDLEASGLCRQVLLSVDEGGLELAAILEGPDPARHEKNWMPFLYEDELCFVYSCRPFSVMRWAGEDSQSGRLERMVEVPTDCRFAALRGGSQGLAVDDGYLFVVHQVLPRGGWRRYVHRFVSVDGALRPSGISDPFVFVGEPVEFCAGIAARGDEVVLSFGVGDRQAALAVMPLEAVINSIDPLSDSGQLGRLAGAG